MSERTPYPALHADLRVTINCHLGQSMESESTAKPLRSVSRNIGQLVNCSQRRTHPHIANAWNLTECLISSPETIRPRKTRHENRHGWRFTLLDLDLGERSLPLVHLSIQAEKTTTFHQSLLVYGIHTGPEENRMFSKL